MHTALEITKAAYEQVNSTDRVQTSVNQITAYAMYTAMYGSFSFAWVFEEHEKPIQKKVLDKIVKMGFAWELKRMPVLRGKTPGETQIQLVISFPVPSSKKNPAQKKSK